MLTKVMGASELTKDELYFASKGLMQLQPSIVEGWPQGHLFPLLIFSENDLQNIVDLYCRRFNLSQGQQELLGFIQQIHRIHRQDMDYERLWRQGGSMPGPLFVFIFMDNYHDQSGWEIQYVNPHNIDEVEMLEEDRIRIIEEMKQSTPNRMKLNFLYLEKSQRFSDQKFLMEVWVTLPTEENEILLDQSAARFEAVFDIIKDDSATGYKRSAVLQPLIEEDRGDLLRVGLERLSTKRPLTAAEFDYQQFIVRIWELVRLSREPGVVDAWRSGEQETLLMVFRMNDSEDAKEYRNTYGPIVRLTKEAASLHHAKTLQAKESAIEEDTVFLDYELELFEGFLRLFEKFDQGGIHLMFLHETWWQTHDLPFSHLMLNFINMHEDLEL
jgi:hypothetical protein